MKIAGLDIIISLDNLALISESGGVALESCVITESLDNILPSCILTFTANQNFLNDYPLSDGALLQIFVSDKESKFQETWAFRLYNLKLENIGQYIKYTLYCSIDMYEFYRSPQKYVLKNYSSEVFKQVASDLHVEAIVDTTNDTQLWVPSNMNLVRWLSNVAMYGWVDETSCMQWAVTRNKQIIYKNISNIIKSADKENGLMLVPTDSTTAKNQLPYKFAIPEFNFGSENIGYGGYGGTDSYFDFPSYQRKEFSAQKVVASSNMLNINKELSKGLENIQHAFNVGNFHEHYYDAYMQNKRQLSTYSTYMNIMVESWYPLTLLLPISLKYASDASSSNKIAPLDGLYLINKLVTRITNSTLSLGIQLVGQGYNTSNSTRTY